MAEEQDYLEHNRKSWDDRTQYHLESEFYDQPGFLEGKTSLKSIELDLLGDVRGKSILHLQCHFGQDSLSLARMGAKVTGIDLSPVAIQAARDLNEHLQLDARFYASDVYSTPEILHEKFDMVFTTYGVVGWLPDMDRWAKVVAHFLKPGGQLVFAEFHPVVWMFDAGFNYLEYPYLKSDSIVEENTGTYADRNAPIRRKEISWNHGLSEVMQPLINAGLEIRQFREFDYSPHDCFQGMEEFEPGKFRIARHGNKLPMVYALSAVLTPG